jgi:hypothetical protein
MAVPIFNNSPSYLTGAGGVRQGSSIPLNLPSSLVRPTSAATRAVDQARIRKENEERLKGISDAYNYVTRRGNLMFDDAGVVMQDAYDNASVAIPQAFTDLGNFAGDVAYNVNRDMIPVFQLGRDIKSGVGSAFDTAVDAAAPYVDNAVFAAYPYVDTAVSKVGELADKAGITIPDISIDSIKNSLKANPQSAYEIGQNLRNLPSDIFDIASAPARFIGDQIGEAFDSEFADGLMGRTKGQGSTKGISKSGTTPDTFKKGATGTPTIDPSISAAVNDPLGLGTAKIQTKLKDTSALDKSEGQGSGADNWFDAVNERVDLMAMGAAMLAGSSSGEGTLANLGRGLQAGIASRKGEATAAEAKKYKDATLALALMREQSNRRKNDIAAAAARLVDPFKNQTAKVNSIVAQLKAANIEGEPSDLNDLATLINTTDPSFVTAPQELRSNALDYFAKEYGNNWFSDGGEIDITKARKGYIESLNSLSGTK